MSDHLKPISGGPPPIKVNRRREGHQGRGQQDHSHDEKKQDFKKIIRKNPAKNDPNLEEQELIDFNKIINGQH